MKKTRKSRPTRIDLELLVQVEHQSRLQQFYAKNLSSGGIFLEMPSEPPPIGSTLKLIFALPGSMGSITTEAEIIHHHRFEALDDKFKKSDRYGIGLKFVNLNKDDRAFIETFIRGKGLRVSS